jgi:ABC-2 type transport system permease protein
MKTTALSQPTFAAQLRAVWIIAKKDWKVFWRYPLNAVSHVFQPIIWVTPVYFMGLAFSTDGKALGFAQFSGTSDYMSYILIGTALSNFILTVFWGMGFALKEDMDAGVLESNWLTPVSRIHILVGRTLTSMFTTTIMSIIMLIIAALLFGFQPTGNIFAAILVAIPMLIGLYGFGFAFAAIVLLMRDANGANFPVKSLPYWLIPFALALPLTYGFDAVRAFLLQTTTIFPVHIEVIILIVFMFVMLWLGAWIFNRVERKVRMLGTLGQH